MSSILKGLVKVLSGSLVGALIYCVQAYTDIHVTLSFIAPLMSGVIGGYWFNGYLKSLIGGLVASTIAVLSLYLYYLYTSWYGSVKLLTTGVIGVLPILVAVILGCLGGLLVSSLKNSLLALFRVFLSQLSSNNHFLYFVGAFCYFCSFCISIKS